MKHCILLLLALLQVATAAPTAEDFVPAELLVGFQPGTRGAQTDSIRNALGANKIKAWPEIRAEHWHLPPGLSVAQAIQALSANPNVLYAEPNYLAHAVDLPNDPRRSEQWAIHNLGQTGGAADADIDAPEAWSMVTDASSVIVGIVDSGMDYRHQDLAANVFRNPGEIGPDAQGRDRASNGIDDDGNGFIDDCLGWNFVNNTNDPMDDNSHGTHVAGTIGAVGNNGVGVAGVAWSVKLMPLKFLNASGSGAISGATDAILYAAKFGVRITSHSWITGAKSKTLESAIRNSGALVLAAAGNNGTNSVLYPAGYSLPNVVSVAATDSNDALASFSNFGSTVHLAAPGVGILSTLPNDTYGTLSGTSMATPHVSGVAALVMAQNPGLTIAGVKAQILNNVDMLPGLAQKVTTGGRLNARRALGAPELPPDTTPPAAITDLAAAPVSPHAATLTWTAPSDVGYSGTAYFYDIRFSMNPINTDADFAAAGQSGGEPVPQAAGAIETFTVDDLPDNRTWYFAIRSSDLFGNLSPLSNLASAALAQADWFFVGKRLDGGANMGNYASVGVLPDGYWAVAYDDKNAGVLRCASLVPPGYGFRRETVMAGGFGPSLAYSPLDEITISHVDSSKRLWFVVKNGTNWISTQIAAAANPHETSLAYAGSDPVVSYYSTARRASGLSTARRVGSTWTTQLVDPGAVATYNQVAIDPAGNPTIAYSHDLDGNGVIDRLKVARWNGTSWNLSVVDVGGLYGTLAYDPTTGNPAVAHWNATTGELRFLHWNGSGWGGAEIVETGPSITGCSLQFGPDGNAYLAYGTDSMRLAIRDAASGTWTVQVVEASTTGSLRNSIRGRPGMTPIAVAYRGPAEDGFASTVRLVLRRTPY